MSRENIQKIENPRLILASSHSFLAMESKYINYISASQGKEGLDRAHIASFFDYEKDTEFIIWLATEFDKEYIVEVLPKALYKKNTKIVDIIILYLTLNTNTCFDLNDCLTDLISYSADYQARATLILKDYTNSKPILADIDNKNITPIVCYWHHLYTNNIFRNFVISSKFIRNFIIFTPDVHSFKENYKLIEDMVDPDELSMICGKYIYPINHIERVFDFDKKVEFLKKNGSDVLVGGPKDEDFEWLSDIPSYEHTIALRKKPTREEVKELVRKIYIEEKGNTQPTWQFNLNYLLGPTSEMNITNPFEEEKVDKITDEVMKSI